MLKKNLLRSLFLSCLLSSASAHSSSLMESFVKDTAAELGVDGVWLWRICTHESKTFYNGSPQPWPFTLNYKKKGRYFHSHQGALYVLRQILEKDGSNALVDVGMCQVNLRWHGDKVESPEDLLDFRANVRIAAGILAEGKRIRGTWEKAAGYYHSPGNSKRAQWYVNQLQR